MHPQTYLGKETVPRLSTDLIPAQFAGQKNRAIELTIH